MQPFNLSRQSDFEKWAEYKLSLYSDERLMEVGRPIIVSADGCLDDSQAKAVKQRVSDYNFALYRIDEPHDINTTELNCLGASLGLRQLDANLCAKEDRISVITDESSTEGHKRRYIPYSNRSLNWHTDGYYNPESQAVRAFILHCNRSAARGGENGLIDPEIIYLFLRRKNPDFIRALCQPDVMRIPPNSENGVCIREETSSSVFQLSSGYQPLGMRYSQRKRHIHWPDDKLTQQALEALNQLLDREENWSFRVKLQAGEGIISNNALHCRQQFTDEGDNKRVFLRARYYNAIETLNN